jgi:uncharacterized protein (DUF362 family)
MQTIDRRDFVKGLAAGGFGVGFRNLSAHPALESLVPAVAEAKAVVSVVRINDDNIDYAVRSAVDLLGGVQAVAAGKERIMLKPNLVSPEPRDVTKPGVIRALAQLLIDAKKDVSIGEGSAAAGPNLRPGVFGGVCRTTDVETLNRIQAAVFDPLGYTDLAKTLKIPLVNLHTGEMAKIPLPDGFVNKEIQLHHSLTEIDLLCSVPMMKTHSLATVTLGMKNLIGVYPGQVYGTVRSAVHTEAAKVESSGTASAVVDMVRANKLGLVVVDASMAMEAQGPSVHQGGRLVKMDLIIAGANPLATDMVAASIMGFRPDEISTFVWAWKAGMLPRTLDEIDVRGEKVEDVRRTLARPMVVPWALASRYGPPC